MDISPSRLEFCKTKISVATTLDTPNNQPICIIDATGNPKSMSRCFDLASHGGRIVFVGLFQGDITLDDPNFHRRELTLMATRNSRPRNFERIIKMMEQGEINAKANHSNSATGAIAGKLPKLARPRCGAGKSDGRFLAATPNHHSSTTCTLTISRPAFSGIVFPSIVCPSTIIRRIPLHTPRGFRTSIL